VSTIRTRRLLRAAAPLAVLAVLAVLVGCATTRAGTSSNASPAAVAAASGRPAAELRLGYFPNVTHATAVYGVRSGVFASALGSTKLTTQTFNAGPAAVEALFAGSLDAAYLGPNPAVNAFAKSDGKAIRIIAGATSGGVQLVVRPEISAPWQLRGTTIADPQTGATQDIALRSWLAGQGLKVDARGAGDVTVVAQDDAQTLQLFTSGAVAGGWLPEPWASRLVLEGGGKVLVDEKDLWPAGRFVTTHLVVRTQYLQDHPQTVKALLQGAVEANRQISADPAKAKSVVNAALGELTGKPLSPAVLDRAFAGIEVTNDPLAASLKTSAQHAFDSGLVKKTDLRGIYDLRLLDEVLGTTVDDAGLGARS
jgi:NitT/TauT family transport system substrate-binding protein